VVGIWPATCRHGGEVAWQTTISVEPGIEWTTTKGDPVARVEARFYEGEDQLYTLREQLVGARLAFAIPPVIRSLITHRH
jgi:hypothetical protein